MASIRQGTVQYSTVQYSTYNIYSTIQCSTVHVQYMYNTCTCKCTCMNYRECSKRLCMCVEMSYTGDDSEYCIGNIQGENRFIIQSQYSSSAIDR